MNKYKGEQAWKQPITEYMASRGLTYADYEAANELLYRHNLGSGPESDKALLEAWNGDTSTGKALRAMSDWNEWQVRNEPVPAKKDEARNYLSPSGAAGILKHLSKPGNEQYWQMYLQSGPFKDVNEYKDFLKKRAQGEPMFFRKGSLDKAAISTTTDPRGARSGSSHFKPDRAYSFSELRKAGYRLLSGARGMVGVTSAQEREHVWLKVGRG
jgi:hypothetical protein